jgi:hypothetical protein
MCWDVAYRAQDPNSDQHGACPLSIIYKIESNHIHTALAQPSHSRRPDRLLYSLRYVCKNYLLLWFGLKFFLFLS